MPGKKWFQNFLLRHPELSCRVSQNLTKSRAILSEVVIRNWFNQIKTYINNEKDVSILEDPRRIFNCDETAFFYVPMKNRYSLERDRNKYIRG